MNKHTIAAATIAVAALLGTSTPAEAIVVTGTVSGLDVADIKVCTSPSLTLVVNKTAPEDLIAGTTFTVEKLAGIDLTIQADWDKLKDLDAASAPKDGKWTAVSDANGRATITGLPIGAYWVSATVPDDGRHLTPASFLVTVPVGSENGWVCNPVINAKFEPVIPTTTPTTTKPTLPGGPPPTTTPTTEPSTGATTTSTTPPDQVLGLHNNPPTGEKRQDQVMGYARQLASTGAAVIGVIGLAAAALVMGLILVTRRRKDEE